MPGKKHPHALHSWVLRLVNSQTNPLVRKLMTHIEDKTENRSVRK